MFLTTVFSIFMVVVLLYLSMDAWIYRRPWVLLAYGFVVSMFSVLVKGTPLLMKSVPNLTVSAEELDLAASVVDPTLVGLAGGLIGAAFVLKLQILHARDLREAKDHVDRTIEWSERVNRSDEDLKLVASSLSNDEFKARLERIKSLQVHALNAKFEAEQRLKGVNMPGLG